MLRTLKNLFKQDREKFVVPKSVQNVIPIKTIWEDGIFLVGRNKYAKTFKFEDINYAVASREDKEAMFLEYSELLNSLDSGATTKITINNRRLNKADFEQTILIPMADDGLDKYRKEYNKMLLDKATGANSIVQDKYVTVSVCKKNIEEARNYFARVGADLIAHFNRLGSKCVELDAGDKLRIFHDFYRTGEETAFHFDITQTMRKGHDFKDFICPDTFEFESDCFRMGDRYGRVIFLREYAAYIKDSMVAELCELNRNMMLSVDIIPVPTDEAVQEVENRLLGVETNITNWQRKQNQNNNFSAVIPYDLEQQRKESKEFLDDLTTRDQRMMFAVLTMVHTADTKEQLDNDTEALLTTARKHLCQFAVLKYQQMDGLNTALPFGVRKIDALRTLTTESLAVFIPFRVQEIYHENGVYYGQNVISKNMIIANRRQLLNGNSFILGVSGAGKSFTAKEEMTNIILTDPNADIIIIDPEREYSPLVKAMQGEVIHISATSENHINAMDMNSDYGDGANPVILKSEFILSLCEQLIGGTNLGAKQKSIIDRCTASVYRYYQQGNYMGTPPTLQDFREELLKQNEPEAQEIALAIELFTDGSLNTFAKHTNVDTHSRLICYDILDLGKQLQPIGMLVVLDSILNRITQNRAKGRNTFIFIDEIYLLFQHEYSANFLFTLWKRVRKYGAYCTCLLYTSGALNKKYRDKDPSANKLLTQNVRIGLDGKKHRRNLNILVCGGSGAGKTRFFCKPNAMQCNTSFVILDPKGEIVRDIGGLLENKGYEVRVLDLINMHRSHCYNPFVYLRNDNDVQRLVTNLFKATTPKGSQSQDPFWDTAASMLLLALVFYLKYEAPPDEQNFPMVMELLRAGEVREDDDSYVSPLDELFDRLEMVNPEHIALKYYRDYHSGSAKTLKSIQITLAARLEKFNLESLAGPVSYTHLDVYKRQALRVTNGFIISQQKKGCFFHSKRTIFYIAERFSFNEIPSAFSISRCV